MKIIFYSAMPYEIEKFKKINEDFHFNLTFISEHLTCDNSNLSAGFDAICTFVNDPLTREMIDNIDKNHIKLILLRCAGFNQVNIEHATNKGIKIARVPHYSPYAIAEHVIALLQTLNRKTHKAYNRTREGNFSLQGLMGFDLYQKTVGIMGLGNIGRVLVNILRGFNCNIMIYDPYVASSTFDDSNIQLVDLETLLKNADIISLHCPLTPKTHKIINQESIKKMKEGVIIINTSRGKLIDTKDMIEGLKSRKIGGLALDVYEEEEQLFFHDHSNDIIQDDLFERLISFNNVLITAHQAFLTQEALNNICLTTLQNAQAFFNQLPILKENCLN